jgi:HPt (histidine-containing phosphotransfer) domain-containing protein
VFDLQRARSRAAEPANDDPVIDRAVVGEIDRLYGNADELNRLLDVFDSESRRLLGQVQAAVTARDHGAFRDAIHALKGNGANVGAMRLVRACREAEDCDHASLHERGPDLMAGLETSYREASEMLRRLVDAPADSRDRDLPQDQSKR